MPRSLKEKVVDQAMFDTRKHNLRGFHDLSEVEQDQYTEEYINELSNWELLNLISDSMEA